MKRHKIGIFPAAGNRSISGLCGPACIAIILGIGWISLSLVIGMINITHSEHEYIVRTFILACCILIPLSMGGLYYAFRVSERQRQKTDSASEKERLLLEKHLRHSQKIEAIGVLAGGIAHDFNNILYAMQGFIELAIEDTDEKTEAYGFLQEISKGNTRASELVKQILAFSTQVEQERHPILISTIVKEVAAFLKRSLPVTMDLQVKIAEHGHPVMADPTQVHRIIMNLCTNAYQAMPTGKGILEIHVDEILLKKPEQGLIPGIYTRLSVRDTGTGIAAENVDHIFDPYFTTKQPGQGTGLGLATINNLVKTYKGGITFESEPRKGTTFTVLLPTCEGAAEEEHISLDKHDKITGTEHILLVDDEEPIVYSVKLALQRLGYNVSMATNPQQALSIFKKAPDDIDIIITDYAMPNMTGIDLAKEIFSVRSDIPIFLCTGFSEIIKEKDAKRAGIKNYIMKPIKNRDLAKAIRKEMECVKCNG